jgi:hypothetical protein
VKTLGLGVVSEVQIGERGLFPQAASGQNGLDCSKDNISKCHERGLPRSQR